MLQGTREAQAARGAISLRSQEGPASIALSGRVGGSGTASVAVPWRPGGFGRKYGCAAHTHTQNSSSHDGSALHSLGWALGLERTQDWAQGLEPSLERAHGLEHQLKWK